VGAQVAAGDGTEALQEAERREAGGDLARAAALLRGVLEREPTSLPALLAYERVLRAEGSLGELIPVLDRLLAAEPNSAIGHQLRVRVLSEMNRVGELERAVDAWIEATPRLETPYREAARVWQQRGEPSRALKTLEQGRSRLRRGDALGLEMGELAVALGDVQRAVREWDLAVGKDGRGFSLVRRRLAAAPDGGARVLPGLVDALTRSPSSAPRQRAAAELAIDAGLGRRAEEISRQVARALSPPERATFLIEVARRADGARLPSLAYWAYTAMLDGKTAPPLSIRSRLGTLALQLGDTAAAREHFLAIEQAFAAGSAERRQAVAVRLELTAREGKLEEALAEFDRFRAEYHDAPELDELAAVLGGRLLETGDAEGAERVLSASSGPHAALARSRIDLTRGDLASARRALLAAAPRLTGAQATETLALATVLGRVSADGGKVLARAMAQMAAGEVAAGVGTLADSTAELGREERGAILDFAAGFADRAGLAEESERIHRQIITELPGAQEAPAALLALGRLLAQREDRREEARSFLERLILDYPRSALVPQARRELDRLQGRVPQL
jgi:tetratricopeptide (TPR) repeat protein